MMKQKGKFKGSSSIIIIIISLLRHGADYTKKKDQNHPLPSPLA
jgi:hypothetical protein